MLITITITIKYISCNYKRQTKTLGFTNLSEKRGKNVTTFFVTFPSQQLSPMKYFTGPKHFSKQKLTSSYR